MDDYWGVCGGRIIVRRDVAFWLWLIWGVSFLAATQNQESEAHMGDKIVKTDEEWREILTPRQYDILREKGTERAFSGHYIEYHEDGTYVCAGCGNELFRSDTKYDSKSGWPSFWKPLADDRIKTETDRSFFVVRTEIVCARCGGHLGHVFEDGPEPTGLRYCVNSLSLDFVKNADEEKSSIRKE